MMTRLGMVLSPCSPNTVVLAALNDVTLYGILFL